MLVAKQNKIVIGCVFWEQFGVAHFPPDLLTKATDKSAPINLVISALKREHFFPMEHTFYYWKSRLYSIDFIRDAR
jgi:hypothetical protein